MSDREFNNGANGIPTDRKTFAWIEGFSLWRFRQRQSNSQVGTATAHREPFVWETINIVFAVIGLLAAGYVFGVHLHETLYHTLGFSFLTAMFAARFANLIAALAIFYVALRIYGALHG